MAKPRKLEAAHSMDIGRCDYCDYVHVWLCDQNDERFATFNLSNREAEKMIELLRQNIRKLNA